jgi:hypothetical protein
MGKKSEVREWNEETRDVYWCEDEGRTVKEGERSDCLANAHTLLERKMKTLRIE